MILRKEEFKAGHNTVFGEDLRRWSVPEGVKTVSYTAYSYGRHYPMFAFDYESETWFETAELPPSRTTSRHLT